MFLNNIYHLTPGSHLLLLKITLVAVKWLLRGDSRIMLKRKGPHRGHGIPIFMYHIINSKSIQEEGAKVRSDPYSLSELDFSQQMDYLFQNGYQTIPLDKLVSCAEKKEELIDKVLIITFDDGHVSNYTKAYPILQKRNFTATFFVTTGLVGSNNMLSWEQIIEMKNNGMDIGSHTLTHPCPADLTVEELRYELEHSKKILEEHLGTEIKYVSSPTGFFNPAMIHIAKEVGYKALCGGKVGINNISSDVFSLRRIAIKRNCNMSTFISLVQMDSKVLFSFRTNQILRNMGKIALGTRKYEQLRRFLLR